MIIKENQVNKKKVGSMVIKEYKINSDFSGALIKINGDHGTLKCLNEDRIYFIVGGQGRFIIKDIEYKVETNDMIFIPKQTIYNIIGKMKYWLICSPEFNPDDDVFINH